MLISFLFLFQLLAQSFTPLLKYVYWPSDVSNHSYNEPFFLTDNDPQNGVLTIYITFLGPAGNSVGGTGDIALINFKPSSTGRAEINISQESILLDPNAKEIVLKGYGEGIIDVR